MGDPAEETTAEDAAREESGPFYDIDTVHSLIAAICDSADGMGANTLEVHGACEAVMRGCEAQMVSRYADATGKDWDEAKATLGYFPDDGPSSPDDPYGA